MFEFLNKNHYTTKLIIELNNAMPHYSEIYIEKTTRKKQKQKSKKQNFQTKLLLHKFTFS